MAIARFYKHEKASQLKINKWKKREKKITAEPIKFIPELFFILHRLFNVLYSVFCNVT